MFTCLKVEPGTASYQQYTRDSRQSVVMLTCSLWFEICFQLNKRHVNRGFLVKKYQMAGSAVCYCIGRNLKRIFLGNGLAGSIGIGCVTFEIC